jgi:hypothetical protein
MGAPKSERDPGQGPAYQLHDRITSGHSPTASKSPVLDTDGVPLLAERSPIVGAPRRATPGWYRWAVDRWSEWPA